jgi:serine/threonine-protein kinase
LGRYQVERELGRGAMGVVYLGTDPKIARQVAIKTLNYHAFEAAQIASLKARFFREAEAAGRLNHPAIVTVYDVGEERDLAYIAMDYVDGQPASAYVHKDNLLAVADVYRLVADVAEALHYAHEHGVVHRDIKPGNIMYRAQNKQTKVADFGIARIVDDSRTRTGDILGSPIYMSPEQLKGAKVSGASDLYSLGVSFYQLLTGELPFKSDSLANLAYQIVNKKHKSVRDHRKELPASAARIINKAMQKDPAKRFADGAAMAEAIRKSLARDFPRQ